MRTCTRIRKDCPYPDTCSFRDRCVFSEPQFDLFEGRRRRDEGIAQVESHNENWQEDAITYIDSIDPDVLRDKGFETFLAEDIRRIVIQAIGEPKHHNCWGALTRALKSRGMIEPTGLFRPARSVKTKAHPVPEYRWCK